MNRSILINKSNKITPKYIERIPFVKIKDINNNEILIDEETYNAYLELEKFLKLKNIEIGIYSAFRSLDEQEEIFRYYLDNYGEEYTSKYVAPVGFSEHHTGLAIDISIKVDGMFITDEKELFNYDDIYSEIHKYLHEFGFILRYPKNKDNETLYPYEPWHIRYIGKFIANILFINNLCLEEYKRSYSGLILLNKKKDFTSHDVVTILSHLFGLSKIGHTGTLDPLAEGLLVVCIGNATKIEEILSSSYKEYIATVKMGIKTDTYDITGNVLLEEDVDDNINIEEVLNSFKKTYMQEVPIYSAVKVNGKKLYEYARNNIHVELPKKEVTIKEISLLEKNRDSFTFKVLVSKGCYIRSLINDISKEINIPMTMTSLVRTKQGNAKLDDAYTLEDVKNNNYKLISIEEVIPFPIIILDDADTFKVSNGVPINNKWNVEDKVLFKDKNNNLLGIYEKKDKMLYTWKNFYLH